MLQQILLVNFIKVGISRHQNLNKQIFQEIIQLASNQKLKSQYFGPFQDSEITNVSLANNDTHPKPALHVLPQIGHHSFYLMCALCSPNRQSYQLPHRQSHMITAAAELVAGRWGAEHCWGSGARTLRTLTDRCYAHGNSAPRSIAVSGPRRLTTAWPGGRLW